MPQFSSKFRYLSPDLVLGGTRLPGWAPEQVPATADGMLFDEDAPVLLPDGAVRVADLSRPAAHGPGSAPVPLVAYAAPALEIEVV